MSSLPSVVDLAEASSTIRVGACPMSSKEIWQEFRQDRLALFTRLAAAGDIVPFKVLGQRAVFVNHPHAVKTILVERPKVYTKRALLLQLVKPLLGDSLISSEGEIWKQQRVVMQPGFHRKQIATWVTIMTEAISSLRDEWAKKAEPGEPFDVMPDLMRLTLGVASRALFSSQMGGEAAILTNAFAAANVGLTAYFNRPLPPLPIPTPRNVRLQTTIWQLHRIAARFLRARRRDWVSHNDLLTLMMAATSERGRKMSTRRLRDNVLAFLFAGYETTTVALAWTLILLAQHPATQQRAADEVQALLTGRTPTIDDLARLPYTLMVIQEAMRLYPPPSFIIRLAEEEDEVAGFHVRKGTLVFICPSVLHRHPVFWTDPERFDPERFAPEQQSARPKSAYIPFNTGPHKCIGDQFALTELHLALAMLLQQFLVSPPAGYMVEREALLSIRPKGNHLLLTLHPRVPASVPAEPGTVPLAAESR
jgi:cytochrome P450